jgi:flagellar motor switch protein FliN
MSDLNFNDIDTYDQDLKRRLDIAAAAQEDASPPLSAESRKIDQIMRIPVVLQVVVGSTTLPVANLLKLGRGAVIPLDRRVGDPVDVMVNGQTIARGEVVVVEDDNTRFGVSLTEIREPQLGGRRE